MKSAFNALLLFAGRFAAYSAAGFAAAICVALVGCKPSESTADKIAKLNAEIADLVVQRDSAESALQLELAPWTRMEADAHSAIIEHSTDRQFRASQEERIKEYRRQAQRAIDLASPGIYDLNQQIEAKQSEIAALRGSP